MKNFASALILGYLLSSLPLLGTVVESLRVHTFGKFIFAERLTHDPKKYSQFIDSIGDNRIDESELETLKNWFRNLWKKGGSSVIQLIEFFQSTNLNRTEYGDADIGSLLNPEIVEIFNNKRIVGNETRFSLGIELINFILGGMEIELSIPTRMQKEDFETFSKIDTLSPAFSALYFGNLDPRIYTDNGSDSVSLDISEMANSGMLRNLKTLSIDFELLFPEEKIFYPKVFIERLFSNLGNIENLWIQDFTFKRIGQKYEEVKDVSPNIKRVNVFQSEGTRETEISIEEKLSFFWKIFPNMEHFFICADNFTDFYETDFLDDLYSSTGIKVNVYRNWMADYYNPKEEQIIFPTLGK